MSLQQLKRCSVRRNRHQYHPGIAVFKAENEASKVVQGINLTRADKMYVPHYSDSLNGYTIVPCEPDDYLSCTFKNPLTEAQLEKISPSYYRMYREKRDVKPGKRVIDRAVDDMIWALQGPIISFPSGWMSTIPAWMKERVPIDRMAQMMRKEKGMASLLEAAIYLYPASLEAPMSHDWANIYMYVTTKTMEARGTPVPEDIAQRTLSDYEMSQLKGLRNWIYKKSKQAFKERVKGLRRGR